MQKERKKEFGKLTIEEEIEIARIIEEKQEEKEDLIKIRKVEKIVSRMFYKHSKVCEKKEFRKNANKKDMGSCYRSQRRVCPKKGKDISIVQNRKGESTEVLERSAEKEIDSTIKITTDITSILCAKEGWKEKDNIR